MHDLFFSEMAMHELFSLFGRLQDFFQIFQRPPPPPSIPFKGQMICPFKPNVTYSKQNVHSVESRPLAPERIPISKGRSLRTVMRRGRKKFGKRSQRTSANLKNSENEAIETGRGSLEPASKLTFESRARAAKSKAIWREGVW